MYRYIRSYRVNKLYNIVKCKYININNTNHHYYNLHEDNINKNYIVRYLSSSRNNNDKNTTKSLRSSRLTSSTFDDVDIDDLLLKPSDRVDVYDDDDDDFHYDGIEYDDIDDHVDEYDDSQVDDKNEVDDNNDEKDDFSLDQYHNKFYSTQDLNNFNQLSYYPPANYADITIDEIKKYFPEGFAGELKDEFQISKNNDDDNNNNNKWMIRDSTKFLFRLIDEYDLYHQQKQHRKNNSTSSSSSSNKKNKIHNSTTTTTTTSSPQSLETTSRLIHSPIELDGLTNRPEWYDTIQRIESYGTELLDIPKSSTKKLSHPRSFPLSSSSSSLSSSSSSSDMGEEKKIDDSNDNISKYLDKLMGTNRDDTSVDKFPNRILLAGRYYICMYVYICVNGLYLCVCIIEW